ncbi:DUF4179 domain-containing protein [Paenibacillus sp. EC2-1]|uniref:DUF4179 domain-containing protein n=1 Tax=Paenibacillus sp. EC2-1 TaxID=3388665 RepID=UPI003BEEE69C
MYEKEEQMLKSYFQDAEACHPDVSDEKLEAAVQEGIRRGKQLKRSRIRYKGLSLLAGALAAVFLLMWGGSLQQTGQVEQMAAGPYPSLQGHSFEEDKILNTANTQGLIQPVGKSVSQGDYTVTVDGVLIGSHQLRVFYTMENHSDKNVIVRNTTLEDTDGLFPISYSSSTQGGNEFEPGIHRLQVDFSFSKEEQLKMFMNLIFTVAPASANARYGHEAEGEEKLKVRITLDLDTHQNYIRTVPLDEVVEIEGQKMKLQKVVFSPTGIVLKTSIDPENTMKVSGLWEGYLDSVTDGKSTKLMSPLSMGPDENGEQTYFFEGTILEAPYSLTLKASGLHAVDPAKLKVVVDTNQEVVLSAPDDNLKFGSFTKDKGVHTLTLDFDETSERYFGSVNVSDTFIDGDGKKHELSESAEGVRSTSTSTENGGRKSTEYLYLRPEDYPQPLTFTLSSYPGVIEKNIEVPIIVQGQDVKYWRSAVLDEIPKPEGAKEAGVVASGNPNIRMGIQYDLKNIGGEQGLYTPTAYFQQVEADGWVEMEDKRMGHVHFFEKDDAVVAIEVRQDEIILYEMEEGKTSL